MAIICANAPADKKQIETDSGGIGNTADGIDKIISIKATIRVIL